MMTDEEIITRAQRWARLHENPKLRSRMDKVLEDASEDDQRRIVLCGQRIAGGLPIKLVPAATKERSSEDNGKTSGKAKRRKAVAK